MDSEILADAPSYLQIASAGISLIVVTILQGGPTIEFGTNINTTYLNTDLLITIIILVSGIIAGMWILTNIRTRQKRNAESFLESVLDTSMNGIISLKAVRKKGTIADFHVTFVNKAIADFLGLSREVIQSKTVLEINPLVKEGGIFEKYVEVTETGKPLRMERSIGNLCFIVLLAKIDDGVTCSFYNITELKNTERKLNIKLQELEEKNIELEQLAYVTSHDLQEPLRKINMFADVLMAESSNAETQSHLSSIVRSVTRMKALISKLQEYSTLNRNKLQFSNVSLSDILKDLLSIYGDALREKRIELSCGELPCIEGIPLQLYTLFDNLLNNAIKYSKNTETSVISIGILYPQPEEIKNNAHLNRSLSYLKIVFSDNGVGFDQANARKIFKIFQKLEMPRTVDEVGIGLALCLKIVRCHQGDIYAISAPGKGSEFHIMLPVSQEIKR